MKQDELYNATYGDIPLTETERVEWILNKAKNKDKVLRDVDTKINYIQSIKWNEVTFTMYLVPKATPRPRHTKSRSFVYVPGAADNKKYFNKMMIQSNWNIIVTPAIFDAKCYFPMPKGMSLADMIVAEKGYIQHISTPDFDNLAKTYTDMLKDNLMIDDRLFIRGGLEKFYSVKPRIEVVIRYMDKFDCLYNQKKIIKTLKHEVEKGRKQYERIISKFEQ